jgi:hypothetical protein
MRGKKLLKFMREKEKYSMKINRLVALAVIALLVVGTMGAVTYRAYAHRSSGQVAQTQDCSLDQADGTEVKSATDSDNVDLQCGDQNATDGQETIEANDTDKVNVEEQVGNQNAPDTGVEAPEVEATLVP